MTLHFILFFVLLFFVDIAAKRQLLKRTLENTVSMNSHFNLREKQKVSRVALFSNHYGLLLRPRFKKSLDLQVSFLVGFLGVFTWRHQNSIYFHEVLQHLKTLIWPSVRFDISLQNFKKPLVDISRRIERKKLSEEYLVIILAAERKLWAIFLSRVHLWKQQTPGSRRLKT